jgi:hypothetical protein
VDRSVFLTTFRPFCALAEINYSKNVELPPLRISYAELQAVLDKAASLIIFTSSTRRDFARIGIAAR